MAKFDFEQVSSYEKAEESPGFLLWRVSTKWRRAIESILKTLNLTHPQFVVLATIGWLTRTNQKVSQIEISRHAELDPNTTSQILRSLQTKELIQRERSNDERSKCPFLTKQGAEILSKALPAVEKADQHFFSAVDLHQTKAIEALQKLAEMDKS